MFSLPLPLLGLSLLIAIALCVHVVRTGQQMYWLWIILAFQPIGGLVYFIAVIGPQLWGGRTARKVGAALIGELYVVGRREQPTGKKQLNIWSNCSVLMVFKRGRK